MSDPERSVASTTIVSDARPAIVRLRAGKHQRKGLKPGGISGHDRLRAHERPVQRALARWIRDVGTTCEHAHGGPSNLKRPGVRRRVDAERHAADDRHPRGRESAAQAAGHLQAIRPGAARPDDGHRRQALPAQLGQPSRIAGDVQHRRRVRCLRETTRVRGVVLADGDESGGGDLIARGRRVEGLVGAIERGSALTGEGSEQALVAEREQLGDVTVVTARPLDVSRQPRQERAAPQAPVTGVHAAISRSRISSWRSPSASLTCVGAHARAVGEIGDRSRHAQDPLVSAGAQHTLLVGQSQRSVRGGVRADEVAHVTGGHLRVGAHARASQPHGLTLACLVHGRSHLGRRRQRRGLELVRPRASRRPRADPFDPATGR